jgi:hypothetical protein
MDEIFYIQIICNYEHANDTNVSCHTEKSCWFEFVLMELMAINGLLRGITIILYILLNSRYELKWLNVLP